MTDDKRAAYAFEAWVRSTYDLPLQTPAIPFGEAAYHAGMQAREPELEALRQSIALLHEEKAMRLRSLQQQIFELRHDIERSLATSAELATENERLREELRIIAMADTYSWDDPTEYEAWAKNRARAAISKGAS